MELTEPLLARMLILKLLLWAADRLSLKSPQKTFEPVKLSLVLVLIVLLFIQAQKWLWVCLIQYINT